ncbi:hypothetical protein [uncultured Dysosmobacter sp.]|uniref:hypothetical protein n=1 Tax=uncultured Dysosmobacter sp. TaxID=2591384 RepID=UPI002633BA9A|nr:hypothetical protein [uncultured Dysosmobacter sp.]
MKQITVFGHATVTVSVVINVRDGTELSEKEILSRARKKFGGIHSFYGNGGDDKLIGVSGDGETISADEEVVFDDFMP